MFYEQVMPLYRYCFIAEKKYRETILCKVAESRSIGFFFNLAQSTFFARVH